MDEKQKFSSHDFPEVYKELGINVPKLGCVMLDIQEMPHDPYLERMESADMFYTSENKDRFWIDGYVAGKTPHVTLLYGLLEPAYEQKDLIDQVLKGWSIRDVEVESIGYFPSPYKDDPYYCIVGHIKITPELLEGHQRLELLPHVNTFPGYKAHITLAYVKKDDDYREWAITNFESWLPGRMLRVSKDLNYGSNKKS